MIFLRRPGDPTPSHRSPPRLRWSPSVREVTTCTNNSTLSDAFVSALAEVQENMRVLHQSTGELQRAKDRFRSQCERLQFNNYRLQDELSVANARIGELEQRVETQQVHISEMTLELEDAQTIVTTLQDDLSAKEIRISKYKDTLATRVAELHSDLSAQKARFKELQVAAAKKFEEGREAKLVDEINKLRAHIDDSAENCVICKAAPAIMLYDTCRHLATCEPCATTWRTQAFTCPYCSQRNTV